MVTTWRDLLAARAAARKSQQEIAEAMGEPPQLLSYIETGKALPTEEFAARYLSAVKQLTEEEQV